MTFTFVVLEKLHKLCLVDDVQKSGLILIGNFFRNLDCDFSFRANKLVNLGSECLSDFFDFTYCFAKLGMFAQESYDIFDLREVFFFVIFKRDHNLF
jgi:hypothetical protein